MPYLPYGNAWPHPDDLIVTPDETDAFVDTVRDSRAVVVDWPQYGGRTAYRITLGTPGMPHVYFTRPHAHEPAGTAACHRWIERLCFCPSDPWSEWALAHYRISFLADANPSGSQRAPVKFWDGTEFENETFFLWMFGESGEKAGERFPRLNTWDDRDVTPPRLLGIAYEQVDAHTYVEPNRDHRSTFFKAFYELHADEPVDVWLDLHQTEYVGSDRNTHVNLPTNFEGLDPGLRAHYQSLGGRIHARWRDDGANPRETPQNPYRTNITQFDFLNAVWSSITPNALHLVTEVQNNSARTPVGDQVRLQIAAMDEVLRYVDTDGPALRQTLLDSRAKTEAEP